MRRDAQEVRKSTAVQTEKALSLPRQEQAVHRVLVCASKVTPVSGSQTSGCKRHRPGLQRRPRGLPSGPIELGDWLYIRVRTVSGAP